jgi:hypothetical protein
MAGKDSRTGRLPRGAGGEQPKGDLTVLRLKESGIYPAAMRVGSDADQKSRWGRRPTPLEVTLQSLEIAPRGETTPIPVITTRRFTKSSTHFK